MMRRRRMTGFIALFVSVSSTAGLLIVVGANGCCNSTKEKSVLWVKLEV